MIEHDQTAKAVGDVLSASIAVGALFKWLPAIAALLTIVWTLLRIYESDTVQRLIYGPKRPE